MISLVVTVIVLVILALLIFTTSSDLPDEATYARFVNEITNVQDGVYDERIKNAQHGDSEEKINAGFKKVTLLNAPDEFESFDIKTGAITGYVIGLDKIRYTNAEFGKEYSDEKTVFEFDKDDAYVYDATGSVYYLKGLEYQGERVYSLANATAAGLGSTEDGPIITNIIVESGELEDGRKTNAKAKIVIYAFPRNDGDLSVFVRTNEAKEQPDGTYATQVSRNGTYAIIVTEENGGRTVSKVTVSGIVESIEPPTNLSMIVNSGDAFAREQDAYVVVRADGATKMLINKNNPLKPGPSAAGWESYKESFTYNLGTIEGNVTLYAWFKDEFENITDTIVKATVLYDKTPPSSNKPTLTTTGPYVIIKSNQEDNLASEEQLKATMKYGYRKADGTAPDEDKFTWENSQLVGPLDNNTEYEFVTKATDMANNSTLSDVETYTVEYDYEIRFDVNGGVGEFETAYVGDGETYTMPAEVPTKIGYVFAGWSENINASGDSSEVMKPGDTYSPTGLASIKILYAIWNPNPNTPYKILHYVEKVGIPGEYELKETENLTGTTGQEAVGYPKSGEGYEGLTENLAHTDRLVMDLIRGDGSTTLKIYYTRMKYTLTVLAENGTASASTNQASYETSVQLNSTPAVGYEFDRWIIQGIPEGSTEYSNFTGTNGNLSQNTQFKMLARNTTLIAKFKLKTYSISYDLNGGTVSPANPTEYTKETPAFTLNNPVKPGYDFAGWTGTGLGTPTIQVLVDPEVLTSMSDRSYTAIYSATSDLLSLVANPSTPTNGSVFVTVLCLDANLKLEYKIGENGSWNSYVAPFEVKENTVIYARAKEETIIIDEDSLPINTIDKELPRIEKITISDNWIPGSDLVLKVEASDNLGISSFKATTSENVPATFEATSGDVTIAGDGLNYVWVKDQAGNVASGEIYAWDISEKQDKKVYAVLNGDTLIIAGAGATKAYNDSLVPYREFRNQIKKIEISENVTVINDNVISSMSNVKNIKIPSTLTDISENAMIFTNNFTNIEVASGNQNFVYENFTLFNKNKTIIYVHSKADDSQTYEIPRTVTNIRKLAFYDNDNIKKIIASGNANLSERAFEECSELVEIEGEIGGTTISKQAFAECRKLEIITLSQKLENIGAKAFYNTTNLSILTMPKSVKELGTNGTKEVFKNIGITSANEGGKGVVRYYQSTTSVHEYAITYPNEANFQMIDDIKATLLEFTISTPTTGTYPIGTVITFIAKFDEELDITKTTLPTLTIKIGNGTNKVVTEGAINGSEITYKYTVTEGEEGKVVLVKLEGQVYDKASNITDILETSMSGSEVTINTLVKLEEGTNTYYFTKLQDAVNAAKANPETASKITILKDILESVEVPASKNIILDVNGKTIEALDASPAIINNATLEITNSGTITANAASTIENQGGANLKISNVTLENVEMASGAVIKNANGANINIDTVTLNGVALGISNDGTLSVTNSEVNATSGDAINNAKVANIKNVTINASNNGVNTQNNAKTTISGGTIKAGTDFIGINNNGIVEVKENTIIDAGKTFVNEETGTLKIYEAIVNYIIPKSYPIIQNKGNLEIHGGEYVNECTNIILNENGNVVITGGKLTTTDSANTIINKNDSSVKISGGIIQADMFEAIINEGTLEISKDAFVNSDNSETIMNRNSLAISGGTICGNNTSSAIKNENSLIMTGGTILLKDYGKCGINSDRGSIIDISGAKIKTESAQSSVIAICLNNTKTSFIDNTTIDLITAGNKAVGIEVLQSELIATDLIIDVDSANEGTAILNRSGDVTLGVDNSVIVTDMPRLEGETSGYSSIGGTFNFYDGMLIGSENKALSGGVTNKPESSFVKTEMSGDKEVVTLGIDLDAPKNVTLVADITGWSNTEVTLTGSAEDDNSKIIAYAFSTSGTKPLDSEWEQLDKPESQITKTKKYAENTSIYFHVKDFAGNTAVSNKVQVKYDNAAPTITKIQKNPLGWTNTDVTLTLTATDDLSGVAGYEFTTTYHEPTKEAGNYTYVSPTTELTATTIVGGGKIYVYVIDDAGNVKYTAYEVDTIDTVKPTISITSYKYENEKTKIEIEATDDISGINQIDVNGTTISSINSSTKENTKVATFEITKAGLIEIKAIDKAGNEAVKEINAYLITYEPNCQTGENTTVIKVENENITIAENKFVNAGSSFRNWNTKPDGTGTTYEPNDTYSLNESIALYAIWNDLQAPEILKVEASPEWVVGSDIKVRVTAKDNVGVTGYAITQNTNTPTNWSDSQDLIVANGNGKYYIWAKDADGNTVYEEVEIYNVSKVESDNSSIAIITKDGEKVTLSIEGNGETRDFAESEIPWKDKADEITNVEIKDGITTLGSNLLSNLPNAEQIIISDTVTNIALDTFVHTNNYESILVEGNKFVYTNGMLYDATSETLYVASTKETTGKIVLPVNLGTMAPYAFENSTITEIVSIPNVDVPEGAFKNATALEKINAEDGIGGTTIGRSAFEGCTKLEDLDISKQLKTLGDKAFYNCTNLTDITIPETVTTIEGTDVFINIGTNAGTDTGKGYVYYYASCEKMVEYATNAETENQATFIPIDDIKPVVNEVVINNNDITTINNVVTVRVNASDNIKVDKVFITTNANLVPTDKTSGWLDYDVTEFEYTLPTGNGEKTLYVWAMDNAGNISEESKSDSIILAINTFEITGSEEIIQYVDTTGKDYYDYRDLGYTLPEPGFTVEVTENVDHTKAGEYQVTYKVKYEGEDVSEHTRTVKIIENGWASTEITNGDYTFVLHKTRKYVKIVKHSNSAQSTTLEIPSTITYNAEELKVIDVGDGENSLNGTGNDMTVTKVVLPETVIAISDHAFSGYTTLEDIEYTDSLMTIGKYAFSNNTSVGYDANDATFETVVIKSNVREVKEDAFRGRGINSLTIEDGVKSIETCAFYETIGSEGEILEIPASVDNITDGAFGGRLVEKIIVSEENQKYKDVDDKALLNKEGTALTLYAGRNDATEYTVPDGVVRVSTGAFSRAANLEKVTLADTTINLLHAAFRDATKLKTVENIDQLVSISNQVFMRTGLEEFEIPAGITTIGNYVFDTSKLTDIHLHAGITSIGQEAYSDIPTLNSVVIDGTPTINYDAFRNSSALKYIIMTDYENVALLNKNTSYIPANAVIYAVSQEMELKYESDFYWSELGEERIKCIAELIGDAELSINHGETYVEQGVTLLGEIIASGTGESTLVPDLEVVRSTDLDNEVVGTYDIKYSIQYRGEEIAELIRKVIVLDTAGAEITDITTATTWTPGTNLKLTITAEDDYDNSTLQYTVTEVSGDVTNATWSSSSTVTVKAGTNYLTVKDASDNITIAEVKVWDISANGDMTVFAYLKPDGELVVTGNGETMSLADSSKAPWLDEVNKITKLTIEEGVTKLNNYIVGGLESVSEIYISATATIVGTSATAFAGTNNFDTVVIADGNTGFKMLDQYTLASYNGKTILAHSRKDPRTTITIPEAVTSLHPLSFTKNNNIETLVLEGNTDVEGSAFANCVNLKTITGEVGNTRLMGSAFSGAISLENVTIAKTVTTLGTNIFKDVPGPVYYYASCDAMKTYATTYPTETDFRVIDDTAPNKEAPTLKASSSTIVATAKQTDEYSTIAKVEYNIRKDGEEYDDSAWQSESYFLKLDAETKYYVKTRATDACDNVSESEEASITTVKVPDSIEITASTTSPTSGDVIVTVEWPAAEIENLYGSGWPAGTEVVKQIGIKEEGGTTNWSNTTQDADTEEIIVSKNNTTIFARLYDGKNYTVQTISLTVGNIDKVKPTGTIIINEGDAETLYQRVALNLTAEDNRVDVGYGVKYYYASESSTTPVGNLEETNWLPYTGDGDYDFELTYARGTKTVYVWYMDAAGNVSDAYSDTITLLANAVRLEQNGTTTYYDSLEEAIDAADDNYPQVASRITLLKNITDEDSINISRTQNIVIDMNGYNITQTANSTVSAIRNYGGSLVLENTMTGTKESSVTVVTTEGDAICVENTGLFEVDSVSLKAEAPNGTARGIQNYWAS